MRKNLIRNYVSKIKKRLRSFVSKESKNVIQNIKKCNKLIIEKFKKNDCLTTQISHAISIGTFIVIARPDQTSVNFYF